MNNDMHRYKFREIDFTGDEDKNSKLEKKVKF